ncbi:hypothetical protein Plo01_56420 [Planobispora longispora]|uniref:Uncharacterized protein n=1 Tax=Planobispora longispora TaxID=28887 RepID=A0A8J3RVZ4_9ACTN|nr:hypothetical protein Plo01_56420 [Planobispora longispora]
MPVLREDVLRHDRPVQFFSAGVDLDGLRREIFFLAYHLHWSWGELMDLDIAERRVYVSLLIEQIERENSRMEEAR